MVRIIVSCLFFLKMTSINILKIRLNSELNEFNSLDLISCNIFQHLILINKFFIKLSYLEESLIEVESQLLLINKNVSIEKKKKKKKFTDDDGDSIVNNTENKIKKTNSKLYR